MPAVAFGVTAWPTYAQTGDAVAEKDASEQIIVSSKAQQQSRVLKLLHRLLGKSEKLNTTGSEVVSVPKAKSGWLEKRLERLGAKVTRLRENWNHILTLRPKEDVPLTPKQKSVIDKVSISPETVSVGVLKMPDAAVAELALTRFEQSVGTKGRAGPKDDPYAKVILPMSEGRYFTLVRKRPPDFTPGGCHLDR